MNSNGQISLNLQVGNDNTTKKTFLPRNYISLRELCLEYLCNQIISDRIALKKVLSGQTQITLNSINISDEKSFNFFLEKFSGKTVDGRVTLNFSPNSQLEKIKNEMYLFEDQIIKECSNEINIFQDNLIQTLQSSKFNQIDNPKELSYIVEFSLGTKMVYLSSNAKYYALDLIIKNRGLENWRNFKLKCEEKLSLALFPPINVTLDSGKSAKFQLKISKKANCNAKNLVSIGNMYTNRGEKFGQELIIPVLYK